MYIKSIYFGNEMNQREREKSADYFEKIVEKTISSGLNNRKKL